MLFASLAMEREPLSWAKFPDAFTIWLQNTGGVSAMCIALILAARYLTRDPDHLTFWQFPPRLRFLTDVLRYAIIVSGLGYLTLGLVWLGTQIKIQGLTSFLPRTNDAVPLTIGDWILTASGMLALLVALTPFVLDVATRIRWSRIWAIAGLSWKEAVRSRVVWVFGFMALIFLFADWFVPAGGQDQIRNYVRVLYLSMTVLFLLTAGILGSFSIPNDVKNNSIHTIVTKPVEKFEIVLGRFLGYGALLTIGLFGVTCLSLIYLVRGVNEESAKESYTARVPYYGTLHFAGTKDAQRADSVGREWGYRSYITGPTRRSRDKFRQYAIWDFADVPAELAQRPEPIRFEFSFDIFRLSKGEEGKGVFVTFIFADGDRRSEDLDTLLDQMHRDRGDMERAAEKAHDIAISKPGIDEADLQKANDQYDKDQKAIKPALMRKYRLFEVAGQEVTDFHTQKFEVPPEIFKVLLEENADGKKARDPNVPPLRVFLSVDMSNEAQMLGVARQDFYLLPGERPFWQNFLKGVVGMWCTHMIVLGVAIACSAYLSAVISLLCTMFLFIAGIFVDYLREVADKKLDGGGPTESIRRLVNQSPLAVKFDASPTTSVMHTVDDFFSWWIGRILNLVPDITRHDLHQYVANGFDIAWLDVLLLDNVLPVLGYLAPWAILAYYLMKYREIANPS